MMTDDDLRADIAETLASNTTVNEIVKAFKRAGWSPPKMKLKKWRWLVCRKAVQRYWVPAGHYTQEQIHQTYENNELEVVLRIQKSEIEVDE